MERTGARRLGRGALLVAAGVVVGLAVHAWWSNKPARRDGPPGSASAAGVATAADMPRGPGVALLLVSRPEGPAGQPLEDAAWGRAVRTHGAHLRAECRRLLANELADADSKLRQTRWFAAHHFDPAAAAAAFESELTVTAYPDTALVAIHVDGPAAEDANALANTLADAYVASRVDVARTKWEKQVIAFKKERIYVDNELNEEVMRQLREKEDLLGRDQVGTAAGWNGKQRQMESALRERTDAGADAAAAKEEADRLDAAVAGGTIPADVAAAAADVPRVRQLEAELTRVRLAAAEAAEAAEAAGPASTVGPTTAPTPAADDAARLDRRAAACLRILGDAVAEARKTALAGRVEQAKSRLDRADRRMKSADDRVTKLSKEMGDLNKSLNEYAQLQDRMKNLRAKQERLDEEISRINQFELGIPKPGVEVAAYATGTK